MKVLIRTIAAILTAVLLAALAVLPAGAATGGTWTEKGSLPVPSLAVSGAVPEATNAVKLLDGNVMTVEYELDPRLLTAIIYNPATGRWTPSGALPSTIQPLPYTQASIVVLRSGKVLMAGVNEVSGAPSAFAELYDPVTDRWSATGQPPALKINAVLVALPNGGALLAGGGYGTIDQASAQIWTPMTGQWSQTARLNVARRGAVATTLSDGRILVSGGFGNPGLNTGGYEHVLSSAEIYDPTSGKWTLTGPLTTPSVYHTATLLQNGQVLLAGGYTTTDFNGPPTVNAELYNPATNGWAVTQSMNDPRAGYTATRLPNGMVLAAGGIAKLESQGSPLATQGSTWRAELYDPVRKKWLPATHLNVPRDSQDATLLNNGTVLIDGGEESLQTGILPDGNSCNTFFYCSDTEVLTTEVYTP